MNRITLYTLICLLPFFYINKISAHKKSDKEIKFLTYYEIHNFNKTPRYNQTVEFCKLIANNSTMVNYTSMGISPQKREIPLIILDKDGLTDPKEIRNRGRAIVLVQASIHAGEPDGKDAGLMLIRDIAIDSLYLDIIQNVSLLFIPIINTDGHEDFGTHYRINQNGPEEVGSRFTANRLNMNRDFIKADALETRAFLNLYHRWLPELFIDIHVTNGADFQYVTTYGLDHCGFLSDPMHKWSKEIYEKNLLSKMERSGYPIFPYLEYTSYQDSTSLLLPSNFAPQYSNGYASANNRLGLLVENHIYKPYKERVTAAYNIIINSMEIIGNNKESLFKSINETDNFVASHHFINDSLALSYKHNIDSITYVDFLAWKTKTEISELSGAQWSYSDREAPVTYSMPIVTSYIPQLKIKLPKAYIIPKENFETIELLKLHGIDFCYIPNDTILSVETYRFINPKWSQQPYEGRITLNTEYTQQIEKVRLSKGDIMVKTDQPKIKIVAHMLEPKSPTSLVYWGFFNSYVAPPTEFWIRLNYMEVKGRELLEKDPKLKEEFERKKMEDANFASNPKAILQYFMDIVRSNIEIDANRYPIFRLM